MSLRVTLWPGLGIGLKSLQWLCKIKEKSQWTKVAFVLGFGLGLSPRVHMKIRRIDIKEPPESEAELQAWLHNLFIQKDK